jgi:hypothetical protein
LSSYSRCVPVCAAHGPAKIKTNAANITAPGHRTASVLKHLGIAQ